ncbi:hypothetical protein BELL_0649g00060 [Botrytis elliptica]|uniref:Uncharacterized protein n=1 Tax=Botrytis elliptica TaxID=278938 RepID=A0A4Z1JBI6_9HELO|nr:hypothetical protein EAE99_007736 [Botrytis elliptica]TGO70898.1 hypothetical protein BELL_0649g00060 [Botrytis elliptica]
MSDKVRKQKLWKKSEYRFKKVQTQTGKAAVGCLSIILDTVHTALLITGMLGPGAGMPPPTTRKMKYSCMHSSPLLHGRLFSSVTSDQGPQDAISGTCMQRGSIKRDRFELLDAISQLSESKFVVRMQDEERPCQHQRNNLISQDPNRGLCSGTKQPNITTSETGVKLLRWIV